MWSHAVTGRVIPDPLAFAAERRRRRLVVVAAKVKSHTQSHVLRRQMMELHRVVEIVGSVEGYEVATLCIPEIDVAVGQFERDVAVKLVGNAGVQSPGKIPFAERAAEGIAATQGAIAAIDTN